MKLVTVFKVNGISLQQAITSCLAMKIGETTKRLVARASLHATENYQTLTLYHMFQWANQNISGMVFFYMVDQEVLNNAKTYQLEQRYSNCTTISDTDLITASFHYLNPD